MKLSECSSSSRGSLKHLPPLNIYPGAVLTLHVHVIHRKTKADVQFDTEQLDFRAVLKTSTVKAR